MIAVALVKIAFQDTQAIKPLFAHNGSNDVNKIAICNATGHACAGIGIRAQLRILNTGQ